MKISKKCYICKIEKNASNFFKAKNHKYGLHSYCKECYNKKYKARYHLDETFKKRKSDINKLSRDKISNFVNDLKEKSGCYVCGENDFCCLDFHHLDSKNKFRTVSSLVKSKSSKAFEEIKKCVILCSNCHRKLHAGNFNLLVFN